MLLKLSLPPAIASFFQPSPLPLSPLRWWLAPLGFLGSIALIIGLSVLSFPPNLGQSLQFLGYVLLATVLPLLCARPLLRWHLGLDSSVPGTGRRLIGFTLLGVGMLMAVAYGLSALNPEVRESTGTVLREFGLGNSNAGDLWIIITVVIGAPLGEEAFYRALFFRSLYDGLRNLGLSRFQRWLLPHVSLILALIISGAIFAEAHGSPGQEKQQIALFLHGIIYAWIYERSGSIFTSVLAHSVNNALAIGIPVLTPNPEIAIAAPARLLVFVAPLITCTLLLLWQKCLPRGRKNEQSAIAE